MRRDVGVLKECSANANPPPLAMTGPAGCLGGQSGGESTSRLRVASAHHHPSSGVDEMSAALWRSRPTAVVVFSRLGPAWGGAATSDSGGAANRKWPLVPQCSVEHESTFKTTMMMVMILRRIGSWVRNKGTYGLR